MKRRIFSGLSQDIPLSSERNAWWKEMSGLEWILFFCATIATLAFVLGLVTGETIFAPPVKSRSGGAADASWSDSPALFVVLMTANAAVAVGIWLLFFWWLRRRRAL